MPEHTIVRPSYLQTIHETHRFYDALQYPLIYWNGQGGYSINIPRTDPKTKEELVIPTIDGKAKTAGKTVSCMEYYAYQLMIRCEDMNHILMCRELTQQFVVDMWAKVESERLGFLRREQKILRADEYVNVMDEMADGTNMKNVGKRVILPATFVGGPRYMNEKAQDCMTYVRRYGTPDLFITMTCNPQWEEIKRELLPGQQPSHRHDIIARVFDLKVKDLMHKIHKLEMFGHVRAITYTIEWQKRGLPHAHLLVWVEDKLRLDEVDNVIRAELPDPTEDPELFKIVTSCMVHGPCGTDDGFYKGCLNKGKCDKGYPKPFTKETQTATDGYPMYRRRKKEDGGHEAKIWIGKGEHRKTFTLTNQWIVPYNPSLSRFFQTHINVELCSSIKAIKYVCKYINKGSDMAVMGLENVDRGDEISMYQIARYLSTNEAFWKLYGLRIHYQFPSVLSLAVHLENGQRVYYNPDDPNLKQRLSTPPETTLTAFFKLNAVDDFARTLLYGEIPEHYTWDTTKRSWKRRKSSTYSLGRVYAVHPIHAECFNLRLLLHTVRGPTSFEHLKTVNGKVCNTYQEACGLLGLLEDDEQWDKALAECDETCSATELRNLFAMILAVCSPSRPGALWEKYRDSMCEDILRQAQKDIQDIDVVLSHVMINECMI